jgi:hypothetical protein
VVDSDGFELDNEAIRDLLATHTPLDDVSRLDTSVLGADELQSDDEGVSLGNAPASAGFNALPDGADDQCES